MTIRCNVCALLAATLSSAASFAAPLPPVPTGNLEVKLVPRGGNFAGTEPSTGISQYAPTDMAVDGSGRQFVSTLGGLVRVLDASGTLLSTPYLNTNNANTSSAPQNYGMTSIAFSPGFSNPASPGYKKFYTITTEKDGAGVATHGGSVAGYGGPHQDVITEWTANSAAANVFAGTSRELMRIDRPGFDHNTNDLAFGPDGYLYIASGDGGNDPNQVGTSLNAQNKTNVFGKILRIDPFGTNGVNGQYGIPASNPFVSESGAAKEIYSYGHRNPYRVNFDRSTGELWSGEVGQFAIETVDRITSGGNYGWNKKEGTFLYYPGGFITPDLDTDNNGKGDVAEANGYIDPVFQYDHGSGQSVSGGFVYRGSLFPELQGKYVFGDFFGGLFYGDTATGAVSRFMIDGTGSALPQGVYSIGEDENGELYLLGANYAGTNGVMLQIVPEPVGGGCVLAVMAMLSLRRKSGRVR